jgi:hypothetical protein
MMPEIKNPTNRTSTVYAFEVPGADTERYTPKQLRR